MRRRLLNYSLFTLLSLIVGWRVSQRENGKTTIMVDISPPFVALVGYFLSYLQARSNLVLEITDLPESVFELKMFNKPFLRRLTDWVFRHIYRRADHIVTLTPGAKRHIEELVISGAKITTVANWIEPGGIGKVPEETIKEIRQRHGWQDQFVVMYAGGHGKAYDLMTLIGAGELLQDEKNLKIVFMGTGERKAEYQAYCRAKDLQVCEFINPVPRNLLAPYLSCADVCVNLFYKGDFWNKVIGHKIIDYFEAGRPIIFAGDGDTADIIRNASGGIVVPPEAPKALSEAILKMMSSDREETRKMGDRGYAYLQEAYDKETMLRQLDLLLEKL